MSLGGRRTHLIPVLIPREKHLYHASYAHAYSHGCARRLNYGLSFGGQPKRSCNRSITRDSVLGAHFVFFFFETFFPFFSSFTLPSHERERDTRSGRPRERQRADANEKDSSRLVAGMDSSDSFSLMKESSVRLCN